MCFDKQEKHYMELIESNLEFFNTARRKKLIVKYYVADGNRVRVMWGNATIAEDLTIQEAHAFVWGFTSGRARK